MFVSHQQRNRDEALRIAYLADRAGFEFWLDVLDPNLAALDRRFASATQTQRSLAVAAIVEMGLLNSTHVKAVITQESRSSRWVPYEYGRVKDKKLLAAQAACWLAKSESREFPDYLFLGERSQSEKDVRGWLRRERKKWEQNHAPLKRPAGNWVGAEPPKCLN